MTKLTSTQIEILASACGREDGKAVRPSSVRPAAATKIAAKLIELGMAREVRAKAGAPVWREDEQGKAVSLVILKAGRAAILASTETGRSDRLSVIDGSEAARHTDDLQQAEDTKLDRGNPGSKRALIISLLRQPDGTTIEALMAATGWLPHTTRAALSGLRKAGLIIDRSRDDDKPSIYRIVEAAAAPAA